MNFRARDLPAGLRVKANRYDVRSNLAGLSGPGNAESVISPDDLLEISLKSGREGERTIPTISRVSETGTVEIPLVGPVAVAGLEPFEASQHVKDATIKSGIYRQPHCTVEIKSKAVNHVTVMGAVKKPGVHELPRNTSDLVSAIAKAGGLTKEAGTVVEILRQMPDGGAATLADTDATLPNSNVSKVTHTAYANLATPNANTNVRSPRMRLATSNISPRLQRIDLASLQPKSSEQSYKLGDRDVLMVLPQKKRSVHVGGLVKRPGQFELAPDEQMRLLDAVAQAGGSSSSVADKIFIIRHLDGMDRPIVIQASLKVAKHDGRENIQLAAGDMISVEQTPLTVFVDTFSRLIRLSFGVSGRTTVF